MKSNVCARCKEFFKMGIQWEAMRELDKLSDSDMNVIFNKIKKEIDKIDRKKYREAYGDPISKYEVK